MLGSGYWADGVYSLAYKQPAGDQAQIKADERIDGRMAATVMVTVNG